MPKRSLIRMMILAGLLLSTMGRSAYAGGVLRSALDRPDRPSPPLIAIGPTLGSSVAHDHALSWGFAGSILFQPAAASEFLGPLWDWNTGMILEGEWRRLDSGRDLLTADMVLRRYAVNMRDGTTGTSLFVGAGGGLAMIGYPITVAAADSNSVAQTKPGHNMLGSLIFEMGYEYRPQPTMVLIAKAQWRNAIEKPYDYSHWTFHTLVGFPIPW